MIVDVRQLRDLGELVLRDDRRLQALSLGLVL